MNKALFLSFAYCFWTACAQLSLQEEERLYALQKEQAIPLFLVTEIHKALQENTYEVSLPQDDLSLIVGKHTLRIKRGETTQEPLLFNPETLALLYTYAIGVNEEEGKKLAEEWPQWSCKVPHSFLSKLETLLEKKYPEFEQQEIALLPSDVYMPTIDTSLINRYVSIIKALLDQKTLTSEERNFVFALAQSLTKGRIIRAHTPQAQWVSYAKRTTIKLLNSYTEGKKILSELSNNNPILNKEIDVLTDDTFTI